MINQNGNYQPNRGRNGHSFRTPDSALINACTRLARQRGAYGAKRALDAFPIDGNVLNDELAALRSGIHATVEEIADLPASGNSGLCAKARALLDALDNLDPSPELDLARSLAVDVLGECA